MQLFWVGVLLLLLSAVPVQAQPMTGGWSEAVNLSSSETHSEMPSITVDPNGGVHVVWTEHTEDNRTFISYSYIKDGVPTDANEILSGRGDESNLSPSIAADSLGDLHIVWIGGATLYYSNAYATLAGSAQNWSEPMVLEYVQNNVNNPYLIVGPGDILHLTYAYTIGPNSGIYYNKSTDHGKTWADPVVVYKNTRSDRVVNLPRMAVSPDGTIHIIWVEYNYPETFPPIGIRYAFSNDGGDTWSNPQTLVDGPYNEPTITTRGENEVHVAWSGTNPDRYKFHRWSVNKGSIWSEVYRNTELGGFQGFPALVVDSNQRLHWIMIGSVFRLSYENSTLVQDSLYYTEWTGDSWLPGEVLLRNTSTTNNPRDVAAVIALGNELNVVWSNSFDSTSRPEGWQGEIYYMHKTLDAPLLPAQDLPQPTPTRTLNPTLGTTIPNSQQTISSTIAFDRDKPASHQVKSPFAALAVGILSGMVVISVGIFTIRIRKRNP